MLKQIKFGLFSLVLVAALTACQTGDKQVRESALNDITSEAPQSPNTVQPVTNEAVNNSSIPEGPTTTVAFEEERFDFGEVNEGEVVSHLYTFKNTGSEPLIISRAKGSCGCTVPKYTTDPIAPGEEGSMVVEFNTRGKRGRKSQKVTITANTNPPQTFIYIEGNVIPADGAATSTTPTIQVQQ
ncbi:MAG: DUF1573 domain-containing protein [Bacteroidota bacterium]